MQKFFVIVVSGQRATNFGGVGVHLGILKDELDQRKYKNIFVLGGDRKKLLTGKIYSSFLRILVGGEKEVWWESIIRINSLKKSIKKALRPINGRLGYGQAIIHCHDLESVLAARAIKKIQNIPIVYTAHAPFRESFLMRIKKGKDFGERVAKCMENLGYSEIQHVIGVDSLEGNIVKERGYNGKVSIIYNAVDLKTILDVKNNPTKSPHIKKYILVARHLNKKNGVDVVLEAYGESSLKKEIDLIFIGEGELLKKLQKRVRYLGLGNRVFFLGRKKRKETLRYIKHCFISCIPSVPIGKYIEATSLTLLESLAMGVPVIASKIGGIKEIMVNYPDAAYLVEAGNVIELKMAIEKLGNSQKERELVGLNGEKLVEEKFNSIVWFKKIEKVYKEVLGG